MTLRFLTCTFRFHQIQHLAEQILEGQRFDSHSLHPLTLLLVEILQLKHGEDAVTIQVHAAEPILNTAETTRKLNCKLLFGAGTFLRTYSCLVGFFLSSSDMRNQTNSA